MPTISDLLTRGYFPRELPPPFSSQAFGAAFSAGGPLQSLQAGKTPLARWVPHNLARVGTLRRTLAIPNPVLQLRLCERIARDWVAIQTHVNQSSLSLTTPAPGPVVGRAVIPRYTQGVLPEHRAGSRAAGRYIVKADISRCYPSIYTHAIPWALMTKSVAKARHHGGLGNDLDLLVRNGQDGQTMGIPIGPDTSLVIAEIVLTAVDKLLRQALGTTRMFRYLDDFELAFPSYAAAEGGLSTLQQILAEFELALNPAKTHILPLPQRHEYSWAVELSQFRFRATLPGFSSDLVRYFDRAFELAHGHPEEHVLHFAIARTRGLGVPPGAWPLFEAMLLQAVMVEPGTIRGALEALLPRIGAGAQASVNIWTEAVNGQLEEHCPKGHGTEAAWAIWAAICLNLRLEATAARHIALVDDSAVALLALDAARRGLIPSGLQQGRWAAVMTGSELWDTQWLLAYEANVQGWLPTVGGGDHVSADPHFVHLKRLGVRFYDSNAAPHAVAAQPPPVGGVSPP